ncbi:hypothetical protein FA95DRAFT_153741 [Auriscalpium vulgare]|uniref:Uncharacterized protein n=1 Tax=Auriscalpium vulgare TaxID=40419 RepID=A0ACB8RM38_9AGAM|nr:hypothetical protein FA95DRAFT_153741 [Auriscalpium vulgare]
MSRPSRRHETARLPASPEPPTDRATHREQVAGADEIRCTNRRNDADEWPAAVSRGSPRPSSAGSRSDAQAIRHLRACQQASIMISVGRPCDSPSGEFTSARAGRRAFDMGQWVVVELDETGGAETVGHEDHAALVGRHRRTGEWQGRDSGGRARRAVERIAGCRHRASC